MFSSIQASGKRKTLAEKYRSRLVIRVSDLVFRITQAWFPAGSKVVLSLQKLTACPYIIYCLVIHNLHPAHTELHLVFKILKEFYMCSKEESRLLHAHVNVHHSSRSRESVSQAKTAAVRQRWHVYLPSEAWRWSIIH